MKIAATRSDQLISPNWKSSDQRGEFETLGGDGAVEAVAQVEGGVRQHDVRARAQDGGALVKILRRRRVQDRPVPLRDHRLFLRTPKYIC